MHGFSSVIPARDDIDVRTDAGHHHDAVNAEGEEGKQNELQQTFVGFQLTYGGSTGSIFHNDTPFLFNTLLYNFLTFPTTISPKVFI
jgi:hypothetical protein